MSLFNNSIHPAAAVIVALDYRLGMVQKPYLAPCGPKSQDFAAFNVTIKVIIIKWWILSFKKIVAPFGNGRGSNDTASG